MSGRSTKPSAPSWRPVHTPEAGGLRLTVEIAMANRGGSRGGTSTLLLALDVQRLLES